MKNMRPIEWNERIRFECCGCGACCRNVHQSVPLESLDVYRLTKFLKEGDSAITCMEDVLATYAEEVLLATCGYVTYVLKTTGDEQACIFLKDNRCMIQPVKPKACRTYPLSAEPLGSGGFRFHISTEYPHHFEAGSIFKARDWMKKYFTEEDRAATAIDYRELPEIVRLLNQVPEDGLPAAVFCFLQYKYYKFDLERPFLEQYESNHKELLSALRKILERLCY